jgi:hypothetical protein
MARRLLAALGGSSILAGAIVFGVSVAVSQDWTYAGYISEAGVPGSPGAGGYRLGIVVVALGLVLLGLSMRRTLPVAAGLLAFSGLLASAASAVPCSPGCPLPPYEVPTFGDMVHATASVGAILACVAAMGVIALDSTAPGVRMLSRAWLVPTVPLFLLAASSLLFVGRGQMTGTSERVLLLVIAAWAVTVAAMVALRPARGHGPVSFAGPGGPLR